MTDLHRRRPVSHPNSPVRTERQEPVSITTALEEVSLLRWHTMDLHTHTPASTDYQQPEVRLLDILRQADQRGIDILAITDHNSVRGFADLWREIEDLELLEYLDRLRDDEADRLAEFRRLLDRILLLPGFEFTATFGFHVLAIFPEQTTIRMMEHLLLTLGVNEHRFGSGEVGATTDVLRAYDTLNAHGALVIGAHVNSANGIAMQGLRFGGQTKIAYTQDPNLHALEVTDLAVQGSRRTTASFFDGSKPEYARRMHVIQGSDSHRLERDVDRPSYLGVGDRATDVLLPELSFAALKDLFLGSDFDRIRPHVNRDDPFEIVRAARAEGNTDRQAFHESPSQKRTGAGNVLRDIVAFANSGGGRLFIGASANERRPVAGLPDPREVIANLEREIDEHVTPSIPIESQILPVGSKHVLSIVVADGADKPYAHDLGGILVRRGGESEPATRDEIVSMVRGIAFVPTVLAPSPGSRIADMPEGLIEQSDSTSIDDEPSEADELVPADAVEPAPTVSGARRGRRSRNARSNRLTKAEVASESDSTNEHDVGPGAFDEDEVSDAADMSPVESDALDPIAPRIGVEIVDRDESDGTVVYSVRDLRNGTVTHNVPRSTRGRLWRYAIHEHEQRPVDPSAVQWRGNYGYVRAYHPRREKVRHNLAFRGADAIRVFYGVTEEGMSAEWKATLPTNAS